MRIYIGFYDTDTIDSDRGTGKVARWFETELPESCRLWGAVRQQHSEVINQIQIINGLKEGNITKALEGKHVGSIIYKE